MAGWIWALIIVAAVVLLGVVAFTLLRGRRTRRLQKRFGPEYDRAAQMSDGKRQAEDELVAREKRRGMLDIHELDSEARARYAERWRRVQEEFVDSPDDAVARADALVNAVMADKGYPMEDFGLRAVDISVDHPQVVENYRAAHRVFVAMEDGDVTTEQERQAMRHYRSLFDDLLGEGGAEPRAEPQSNETTNSSTRR